MLNIFIDNLVSGPLDRQIRGTNPTVQKRGTHLKPVQSPVWTGPPQEVIARGWGVRLQAKGPKAL